MIQENAPYNDHIENAWIKFRVLHLYTEQSGTKFIEYYFLDLLLSYDKFSHCYTV